jgi:hypothetical protein
MMTFHEIISACKFMMIYPAEIWRSESIAKSRLRSSKENVTRHPRNDSKHNDSVENYTSQMALERTYYQIESHSVSV